ncbi:nuclear condensin complex subunit Smc4 [Cordyceps fumosorosea ARSEF 2679]|uniref:Nuclear condensin complex subunit Smc4 n=1 Tax=Cordyceps fumosorosea (strain ARSEF 2679) TaxID=1081104 RepID=A0A167QM14_CORFA|nr:nuclear condensin complex subunit Smc4 [Cordyceps fumosorosea ARSEF 2679]OAA57763.1 nuclear condensin complex subunit Smc4 [Cordyceps fumosorosea ARSEF 2679]
MWRPILLLLAALGAAALPAVQDYDGCTRDDLFKSLQWDGEEFCSMLLDPDCYTSISTPAEYATYGSDKLSSYVSYSHPLLGDNVVYGNEQLIDPCSNSPVTSVTVLPGNTTSTPASNATSSVSTSTWNNETTALSPVTSVTVLPGNTTTPTQASNATSSAAPETEVSSINVIPGNATSTQVSNATSSSTGVTSTTTLTVNATTTLYSNTSTVITPMPVPVITPPTDFTSFPLPNTIPVVNTTTPAATPTPFPAANLTGVLRGPAPSSQACHSRPVAKDGAAHVANLENEDIRRKNLTLAFPYVGFVNFDSDSVTPLSLSVRDAAKGSHVIDVSDPTAVTIFDSRNNSMRLDATGIHFVTGHCNLTVSFFVDDMYGQLARQSLDVCSKGAKALLAGDDEPSFMQTLLLSDQCGDPVSPRVRRYPDLRVDDEPCIPVPGDHSNGTWTFDCPWEGVGVGPAAAQRCVASLKRHAVNFLLYDPFNGGCADVSSVVTLLEASAQDMLSTAALQAELHGQIGGNDTDRFYKADDTVMYYLQLWETLKSTLSRMRGLNPGRGSNLKQYLDTYDRFRNFAVDACASVNNGSVARDPAVLSLRAGSSTIPALARLVDVPVGGTVPLAAAVQDPAKVACCPNGAVSVTDEVTGKCAYPPEAFVTGTGCVCGRTVTQASVAFRYRQCDNFVSQCRADSDCAAAGYANYQCLIGSCCGTGVCFDPYECSRKDVALLPGNALE